jgi:hypothetical protein
MRKQTDKGEKTKIKLCLVVRDILLPPNEEKRLGKLMSVHLFLVVTSLMFFCETEDKKSV